jgi:hypothetical protein
MPPAVVKPPVLEMPPAPDEPLVPALAADWPPLVPAFWVFAGGPAELHPLDMDTAHVTRARDEIALVESGHSFPTESELDITALCFIGTSGIMIPF